MNYLENNSKRENMLERIFLYYFSCQKFCYYNTYKTLGEALYHCEKFVHVVIFSTTEQPERFLTIETIRKFTILFQKEGNNG